MQLLDKLAATETIALLWGWQLVAAYHLNLLSFRFCQYAPDQNDVDPDISNRLHELLSSLPGLGLKQMKA